MRWITYLSPADGRERAGLLRDGEVRAADATASLLDLIEADGGLAAAAERAERAPAEVVDAAGLRLLAPIPRPPAVRDFLAFEEHLRNAVKALGRTDLPEAWFEQPVFYFTNPPRSAGRTRTSRSPRARPLSTTRWRWRAGCGLPAQASAPCIASAVSSTERSRSAMFGEWCATISSSACVEAANSSRNRRTWGFVPTAVYFIMFAIWCPLGVFRKASISASL
jgi:hypothetical protein